MNKNASLQSCIKIFLFATLCVTSACTTSSRGNFFESKFSMHFPDEFYVESNNSGTFVASSKLTESVIIVDYQNIKQKENSRFCGDSREDFFSKITSSEIESNFSKFFIKRNGRVAGIKEGYASLAFYCSEDIVLHISFAYKSPSKHTDDIFTKFIGEIKFN